MTFHLPRLPKTSLIGVLLISLLGMGACGEGKRTKPRVKSLVSKEVGTNQEIESEQDSPQHHPRRVAMDLVDNRYLAHLGRKGIVIPLNDPGVFKYTRGGWKSQLYPVRINERQLLRAGGHSVRFFVPLAPKLLEDDVFCFLALEQPHRDQRLSLVINGMRMRATELERGFQLVKTRIPKRLLHEGENEIKLFFAKSRRIDKQGEGAADLRWMALTSDGKSPLRHVSDLWRTGGGSKPSLNFKDIHSWSWFGPIPTKAQLDVRWDDGGGVPLLVHGKTRDGQVVEAPLVQHGKGSASFDLSPLNGGTHNIAALTLERKRPVVLRKAAITVPYVRIASASKNQPKHIFVFNLGGIRRDALSVYNPESDIETPNINKLAQESVLFEDAIGQSSRSIPAHASLLTGTYPEVHQHLDIDTSIGRKNPYLPSIFLNAGWRPILLSSKGFSSEKWGFCSRKGFIDIETLRRDLSSDSEDGMAQWLNKWLLEHKEDRIFAYVTSRDPFILFKGHEETLEKYQRHPYRRETVPDVVTRHFLAQLRFGGLELRAADRDQLKAMYKSHIQYLDTLLGVFLKELERNEILEKSLIVFTSDHGEELFDHGHLGHGRSLNAEQTRIPLLLSFPAGLPINHRISQEVESIDIAPTILKIAKVQTPEQIQGGDLRHLVRHAQIAPLRPAFMRLGEVSVGVQMNGAKMILSYGSQHQLHDLENDPNEEENLYGKSPVLERALKDALGFHLAYGKRWRKTRHGVPTNQSATFLEDSRLWWGRKR